MKLQDLKADKHGPQHVTTLAMDKQHDTTK